MNHQSKTLEGERVKKLYFPIAMQLCRLNWVFENQPMVTGILTQPSGRKKFAADEQGH